MIRVLFVDDEPNVLSGLRRMLHGKAPDWDLSFAESGADALAAMEREPVDVIVSDMKMPGMDGAALLRHVMQDHADTIRIILSGQSSSEEVMKVVSPAHRFLAKPCDADQLVSSIGQAIALRQSIASPVIQLLVSNLDGLPVMPDVYADLTEELNRAEPSLKAVAATIERDPGMSALVLKLVNSAFFGLRREVSAVSQAISFLGMDTITALVLAEGTFRTFDASQCTAFSIEELRRHSIRTATLGAKLAKADEADRSVVEHVFTAGMLHQIGQLVLASAYPDVDFSEEDPTDSGNPVGHVGAYLLGLWGLPDPIVEAVAYHERPSRHPMPSLDALTYVHLACVLATPAPEGSDPLEVDERLDRDYLLNLASREQVLGWQANAENSALGEAA